APGDLPVVLRRDRRRRGRWGAGGAQRPRRLPGRRGRRAPRRRDPRLAARERTPRGAHQPAYIALSLAAAAPHATPRRAGVQRELHTEHRSWLPTHPLPTASPPSRWTSTWPP